MRDPTSNKQTRQVGEQLREKPGTDGMHVHKHTCISVCASIYHDEQAHTYNRNTQVNTNTSKGEELSLGLVLLLGIHGVGLTASERTHRWVFPPFTASGDHIPLDVITES